MMALFKVMKFSAKSIIGLSCLQCNVTTVNVLCPLILQVILALGDYMSVQCHACIGGTNIGEDIRKLDYGQHIVSGTPGRVFGEY